MQALYLSLRELTKAVYYHRLNADVLKQGYFCFVYDYQELMEKGVAGVKDLLRMECILDEKRCEETYEILKQELFRAERKGKLVWHDEKRHDSWGDLNRMLIRQGFQAIKTERPFNLRSVTDEVLKAENVPLLPVIVPSY